VVGSMAEAAKGARGWIMFELSSFMIPWDSIFGFFSVRSILATIALFFLVVAIRKRLVVGDPYCTEGVFWRGLLVTGICSIIAVLVFQSVANFAFTSAVSTEDPIKMLHRGHMMAHHSKPALAILFLTLLIGGGYAFSMIDTSLFTHMISCTVGIGVLEEACKCGAALMVFSYYYRRRGVKMSLSPFVIAGLGFGGGEALHYFSTFNQAGDGFLVYLMRAWWCVPLHLAWTLAGGSLIVRRFSGVPDVGSFKGDQWWALLACLVPPIVLHGVYDAFCFHNNPLSYLVGVGTLIWGFAIFARSAVKKMSWWHWFLLLTVASWLIRGCDAVLRSV